LTNEYKKIFLSITCQLTKRFSGENFVCPEFSSKNRDATDFSLNDIYEAYQMILSLNFLLSHRSLAESFHQKRFWKIIREK